MMAASQPQVAIQLITLHRAPQELIRSKAVINGCLHVLMENGHVLGRRVGAVGVLCVDCDICTRGARVLNHLVEILQPSARR